LPTPIITIMAVLQIENVLSTRTTVVSHKSL
jgi:hypothetical protein